MSSTAVLVTVKPNVDLAVILMGVFFIVSHTAFVKINLLYIPLVRKSSK